MIDNQSEQFINKNSLIPNKEISKKTAEDKLNILMDDNFKEYGIRFVNIGEYKTIIQTKEVTDREIFVFQKEPKLSFKRYLNYRKQRLRDPFYWSVLAEKSTDWTVGIFHMAVYRDLLDLLRLSHSEAKSQIEGRSHIREKTMEIFRYSLRDLLKNSRLDFDRVTLSLLRYQSAVEDKSMNENDIETIGKKNLDIMKTFFDTNDASYLKEPSNLRSFIHTVAYYPFISGKQDYERSYHMALIFDVDAISDETTWGKDIWRKLKTKENITYNPSNHLLGVIVTMPDKTLVQEVVDLSANAGKISHPVFDDKTVIRYP